MKVKLATTCFLVGTLLAPIATLADEGGERDRTHPLTYVKDSVITTKIKAKLADEKLNNLVNIKVDTDDHGAVVLAGKVRSPEDADKAVSIARNTEGVTSVRSDIQVRRDD
jgi:hyperosmotically inducible protein